MRSSAAIDTQRSPYVERDLVRDELNRTVAEDDVDAAGMSASSGNVHGAAGWDGPGSVGSATP